MARLFMVLKTGFEPWKQIAIEIKKNFEEACHADKVEDVASGQKNSNRVLGCYCDLQTDTLEKSIGDGQA